MKLLKVESIPKVYYLTDGAGGIPHVLTIVGNIATSSSTGYLYIRTEEGSWQKWQNMGNSSESKKLEDIYQKYLADIVVGEGETDEPAKA